ncbi:MAG: prepilin-type N-terminal cleavage/methylation domain-containing protein [Tissierellaceae bacterium]
MENMWKSWRIYRRCKGFTLIELVLVIALSSMIMLPLLNMLDFSIKASTIGNEKDELLLNGRYAIEYVKNEIKSADMILPSSKLMGLKATYKTNIGFIIMVEESANQNKFITYHTKDGKLIRIAASARKGNYPLYSALSGFNEISEYMDSIGNSRLDLDKKMIFLDFGLRSPGGESLRLKSDIFIRVPIDY